MLSLLLLSSLSLLASAQTVDSSNCTTGLHIIVARASQEAPGFGIIGVLANQIVAQIPGSDAVAVDYPATLAHYVQSEGNGTTAMNTLIQEYVASCPDSKYALLGYSQGAQVVGDVLCGTSEVPWVFTDPLPSNLSTNFVASVQMGDPSYLPGQPQNNGTSQSAGDFNRTDPDACGPYQDRMVSYCDEGDFFCAKGTSARAFIIHLGYVGEYAGAATSFVIEKYNSAVSGSTSATSSASSSTATGSSTSTGSSSGAVTTTTAVSSSGSTTATTTVTTASSTISPSASTTPSTGGASAGSLPFAGCAMAGLVAAVTLFGML